MSSSERLRTGCPGTIVGQSTAVHRPPVPLGDDPPPETRTWHLAPPLAADAAPDHAPPGRRQPRGYAALPQAHSELVIRCPATCGLPPHTPGVTSKCPIVWTAMESPLSHRQVLTRASQYS